MRLTLVWVAALDHEGRERIKGWLGGGGGSLYAGGHRAKSVEADHQSLGLKQIAAERRFGGWGCLPSCMGLAGELGFNLAYGDQAEANTWKPHKAPAAWSSMEAHLQHWSDGIRKSER